MLQLDGRLPALIVDPDREYVKWLSSDPATAVVPTVVATDGLEAQRILGERSHRFVGIFINPRVANPGGLSVIRCAHVNHVGTPLYLLYDDEPPFSRRELSRLAVHEALRKPLSYAEMIAVVAPVIPGFDPGTALASAAAGSVDVLNVEITAEDARFSPIHIENFMAGHKSFFDLYVRLGPGRYVKLLQAGDDFAPERVSSYLEKGVRSFFIRKDSHASYVAYCDHLASALAHKHSVPFELRAAQTLNAGEETLRFLAENGIPYASLNFAGRFVRNLQALTRDLGAHEHPRLRALLDDAATYDHAVGTALFAALLLGPMQISLERLQLATGMAALFHDVALPKTDIELPDTDEADMTREERLRYHAHPLESAKILAAVRGIDSITIQAVQQHHERRDGHGFPRRSRTGAISPISEVIGISDEFTRLIHRAREDRSIDPVRTMKKHLFNRFSFQVIKAFELLFPG